MLRLPGVLAGSLFCWVFYKWLLRIVGDAAAWPGLVLACFLPPMIALSSELRQYSLTLLFAVSAAYFLECALAEKSSKAMLASSAFGLDGLALFGVLIRSGAWPLCTHANREFAGLDWL